MLGGKLQEMGVALYTFLYNCPKFWGGSFPPAPPWMKPCLRELMAIGLATCQVRIQEYHHVKNNKSNHSLISDGEHSRTGMVWALSLLVD